MQIELSFRDLKSRRYEQGFEDSLTRYGRRIEALLLLSTLAAFASWLVGLACETAGIDQWLARLNHAQHYHAQIRYMRYHQNAPQGSEPEQPAPCPPVTESNA